MFVDAKKSVIAMKPYVAGKSAILQKDGNNKQAQLAFGDGAVIKLSSNENPYGMPDMVKDFFGKLAKANSGLLPNFSLYPDTSASSLKNELAIHHQACGYSDLSPENFIPTNGSDEAFYLLCAAFLNQGENVVCPEYGFLMHQIATKASGGNVILVGEDIVETLASGASSAASSSASAGSCSGLMIKPNLAKLIESSGRAKIMFLANPNNPTGGFLTKEELRILQQEMPKTCLLVLDLAYDEYQKPSDNLGSMVDVYENLQKDSVVVTKTFSKIYGLAGLRLGYMIASQNITKLINRIRPPFNVNSIAQQAGVLALRDKDFQEKSYKNNERVKNIFQQFLITKNIKFYESVGNFLLVDFQNANNANIINEHLNQNGIIVRPTEAYNLPHCLRFSIGT